MLSFSCVRYLLMTIV